MKKILIVVAIVLASSIVSIGIFDYLTGSPNYPANVVRATMHSQILGEDRDLIIHLPPDYDSTKKYPVMYVLDGSSEDEHIAGKFEIFTRAGYAPPVIVIGIPNMTAENRMLNLTPPFMRTEVDDLNSPNGEGDKFLHFLEAELIPYVEKYYPVSQYRLFSGHSRGGLMVMYSLIERPDLFQARFCYSTPFWRQDNIMVSKLASFLSARDSLNSFLYLSVGGNETDNIRSGFQKIKQAIEAETPKDFTWYANVTPKAVHGNNSRLSASLAIRRWIESWKRDRQ